MARWKETTRNFRLLIDFCHSIKRLSKLFTCKEHKPWLLYQHIMSCFYSHSPLAPSNLIYGTLQFSFSKFLIFGKEILTQMSETYINNLTNNHIWSGTGLAQWNITLICEKTNRSINMPSLFRETNRAPTWEREREREVNQFTERSSTLKEKAAIENSTDYTMVCNHCQTNNLQLHKRILP